MRMKSRRLLSLLVIVLAAMAATWTYAQSLRVDPVTPTVLSGPDFGFRVEGNRGGTPIGALVVKMNGQWVEAEIGTVGQAKRISSR
jgi:hypothetical protein